MTPAAAMVCPMSLASYKGLTLPGIRKLVDQALSIWNTDKAVYKPEIARTTFLKSKIFYCRSLVGQTVDGQDLRLFDDAVAAFNDLVPGNRKSPEDLAEKDFDNLVMFWSK